jgi:hypothetical protein
MHYAFVSSHSAVFGGLPPKLSEEKPMCRQTADKHLKAFNKAIIRVEHKLAGHPD